jgi:hypothetical protein
MAFLKLERLFAKPLIYVRLLNRQLTIEVVYQQVLETNNPILFSEARH